MFYLLLLIGGEFPPDRAQIFFHLVFILDADQRAGQPGLTGHPVDGHLRAGFAICIGQCFQTVHLVDVVFVASACERADDALTPPVLEFGGLVVFPGQHPGRQRAIGDDPDLVLDAKEDRYLFDGPFKQTVFRLQRNDVADLQAFPSFVPPNNC